MNRREFVKFIALIAAGAAASPEQIAAYEQYYEANTPHTRNPLVAVDEICVFGNAERSIRVEFQFFVNKAKNINLALNAFGGIFRWLAAPDQKIVSTKNMFSWKVRSPDTANAMQVLRGHVSYIDDVSERYWQPIEMLKL